MHAPLRTVHLTLERPAYGGFCIAHHGGKTVLVPFGLPGERVVARITEERRDYCVGEIEKAEAGPISRADPPCPNHGLCGGCSYQHTSYESEIEIKKSVLIDTLTRIGGMDREEIPDIGTVTGERHRYRSHGTFQVRGGRIGFFRRGSRELVPLPRDGCLLMADEINSRIAAYRGSAPPPDGTLRVALDTTGRVVDSTEDGATVTDVACGLVFERGISQFFQANRLLRGALMEAVRDLAGVSGDPFLDIGCGVGFFSLALAARGHVGTGIDISRESVKWAKLNARHNGIRGVDFLSMPSSRLHPGRFSPEVIVADPPRAGLDRNTRGAIGAMGPASMVYVSCSPPTFARDARALTTAGYRMDRLAIADMFPCTHHIETVARLIRGPGLTSHGGEGISQPSS